VPKIDTHRWKVLYEPPDTKPVKRLSTVYITGLSIFGETFDLHYSMSTANVIEPWKYE